MARRDYYATLGISKGAAPDEVKKAFRNLALRHHPDRNPGDAEAELRFREVAEAYKVLSDPEERIRYERLGPFYRPDGKPPSPDDINEVVSEALSGLFRRKRPSDQGEDLRYTLSLSLEEVGSGVQKTVEVLRTRTCRSCKGDGAEPEGGKRACPHCEGSGKAPNRRIFRSACPHCDGRGFLVVKPCVRCDGSGTQDRKERLQIRVPPGVATGQKLKIRGKGNETSGGMPGDLYVLVSVEEHELFRRRGADLFCELPLMWHEAVLGAEVEVPTLDRTTRIRIPAGTPSEKIFRLAGRGLPTKDGGSPGDLHVKVVIEVPEGLPEGLRARVAELASTLGPDAHPVRQGYDALLSKRA